MKSHPIYSVGAGWARIDSNIFVQEHWLVILSGSEESRLAWRASTCHSENEIFTMTELDAKQMQWKASTCHSERQRRISRVKNCKVCCINLYGAFQHYQELASYYDVIQYVVV